MRAHEIDEALVNAAVGGELRVEGGGHDVSLLDQNGEAVAFGEDLDAVAGPDDAGCADVDHFQRAAGQPCVASVDGAVDLAAVSVTFDRRVQNAKALLRRVRDLGGEQNASGAGAEGWFVAGKV